MRANTSLLLLNMVLRLRFVATSGRAIEPHEVAPQVRALLAPGAQQLEQLGFAEGGASVLESMVGRARRSRSRCSCT